MSAPDENKAALTQLEMIGAMSARLTHALSNHISIITGNMCVLGALKDDPEKFTAALKSAMTAANSAGLLLGRFAEVRRALKINAGRTPLHTLLRSLENWVAKRKNWKLESALQPSDTIALAMNWEWLDFILDAIATQARSEGGTLTIKFKPPGAPTHPSLIELQPLGFAEISLHYFAPAPIDWNDIRTHLTHFPLTAAYELLSLTGATPTAHQSEESVSTHFNLPVVQTPTPAQP